MTSVDALDSEIRGDKHVVDSLTRDVSGLMYTSETDAPYDVLSAADTSTGAIDADAVRSAFGKAALVGSEVRDFDAWFADDLAVPDGADDTKIAYVAKMTVARDYLRANLTDLTVVLLSKNSFADDDSVGYLEIFIVGRSQTTGALIALHTLAVWT